MSPSVPHDVASLDVSVDDIQLVKVLHPLEDLPSVPPSEGLVEWPLLLVKVSQTPLHALK